MQVVELDPMQWIGELCQLVSPESIADASRSGLSCMNTPLCW